MDGEAPPGFYYQAPGGGYAQYIGQRIPSALELPPITTPHRQDPNAPTPLAGFYYLDSQGNPPEYLGVNPRGGSRQQGAINGQSSGHSPRAVRQLGFGRQTPRMAQQQTGHRVVHNPYAERANHYSKVVTTPPSNYYEYTVVETFSSPHGGEIKYYSAGLPAGGRAQQYPSTSGAEQSYGGPRHPGNAQYPGQNLQSMNMGPYAGGAYGGQGQNSPQMTESRDSYKDPRAYNQAGSNARREPGGFGTPEQRNGLQEYSYPSQRRQSVPGQNQNEQYYQQQPVQNSRQQEYNSGRNNMMPYQNGYDSRQNGMSQNYAQQQDPRGSSVSYQSQAQAPSVQSMGPFQAPLNPPQQQFMSPGGHGNPPQQQFMSPGGHGNPPQQQFMGPGGHGHSHGGTRYGY